MNRNRIAILLGFVVLFVAGIRADAVGEPESNPFADAEANAYAEPYADPNASADPGILSNMFDRGRALVHQFIPTGYTAGGIFFKFIPTPENVFRLGKHLVFELPQEIVLYAIQTFCKLWIDLASY